MKGEESVEEQEGGELMLSALIKRDCEDFIVEEIPAYEPRGEGDHLFMWVEKRDAAAKYALKQLARALGVSERDIGSAGNKDRRAITRQYYSVLARQVDLELRGELPWQLSPQLQVLRTALHGNKLRRGHLQGNRFEIVARLEQGEFTREELEKEIEKRVAKLDTHGMKNFYGAQRFGRDQSTVALGEALLAGDGEASKNVRKDRFLKRLALNAVQSAVFNDTLRARWDGAWRVMRGDVLEVVESGGRFVSDDPEVDQARLDAGELVLTGPMHGPKMKHPTDEAAAFELGVLETRGLKPQDFSRFSKLCAGSRRALIVAIDDLRVDVRSAREVGFRFSLPSGSYATVLLEQIFDEVRSQ